MGVFSDIFLDCRLGKFFPGLDVNYHYWLGPLELAPLRISWPRRLQTLGALNWSCNFLFLGFGSLFVTLYLLSTSFWWITVTYGIWYLYDRKTPARGGRRIPVFRRLPWWKWLADYFPVKLIKTAEMDPSKNYIFGYHPHGMFATGAFTNFASDMTGFRTIFPGLTATLLVLAGQFQFPFFREYFMTSGACSVSRDSIEWLLTREGVGNVLVLIVGGAEEVLECRPGSYRVVASTRRGFIRLALKHGASLVPVWSFGENDLFDQVPNPHGSKVRWVQEKIRSLVGFAPAFFTGRGVFNYTFGIIAHRRPINTVVGAPIDVEKIAEPSPAQIEALRQRYFMQLSALFDTHKTQYGVPEHAHLTLL